MTEERLKEIKDSIDFQREYYNTIQKEDFLFDEELELYNEVVRLREIINKVNNFIEKLEDNENSYGDYEIHYEIKRDLLDIIKQNNQTLEQLTGVDNA